MNHVKSNKKAAGGKTTTATRSICTIDSTGSLIQSNGISLWTTSLLIAAKFKKRHGNVIRAIENMDCSAEFHRLNFELVNYLDDGGKPRKSFNISRDGFSLLAMGFTGPDAAKWQELFISAFGKMERELFRIDRRSASLALQSSPDWQVARIEGKSTRRAFTDAIQRFVNYARASGSSHAERYFMTFTKMIQNAMFFEPDDGDDITIRERLTSRQLSRLADAEDIAARLINESIDIGSEYHDGYKLAKRKVEAFSEIVGRGRIGSQQALTAITLVG